MSITDWLEQQNTDKNDMCNPPMDAQTAINFLAEYFDIPDNGMPESVKQTNTYIVLEILNRHSKKFRKEIKNK